MNLNHDICIKKIDLESFLSIIRNISPDLHNTILKCKEICAEFYFYKASYKFGDQIIHNKQLYLSLESGSSISLDDASITEELRLDLMFDPETEDPLGIIIEKSIEIFQNRNDKTLNNKLIFPGEFIGIPRALNHGNVNRSSINSNELIAGCADIFMPAKIGDRKTYSNIQKLHNFIINTPQSIKDQCKTFSQIAHSFKSEWNCEIIFFPRKFIKKIQDSEFSQIYVTLNNIHTSKYDLTHNVSNMWNLIYFMGLENSNFLLKQNQSLLNSVKHIFMTTVGAAVGFKPMTSDESAPVSLIKNFYNNYYKANNDIVMAPTLFDYQDPQQKPIYLSLNHQEPMINALDPTRKKTNIQILLDLKYIFERCKNFVTKDEDLNKSMLCKILNSITFDFFHSHVNKEKKIYDGIISLEEAIQNDERFDAPNTLNTLKSSLFFIGGIKISRTLTK